MRIDYKLGGKYQSLKEKKNVLIKVFECPNALVSFDITVTR